MKRIRVDMDVQHEIKAIVDQISRRGIKTGQNIDILWAEPGTMYSFRCSMSGHWKAVKLAGEWLVTKQ
jgi:hypothetical protein